MEVCPLHDRLLVRRMEEKETVKGGIIIPDTTKEKPQEGEVLARWGQVLSRHQFRSGAESVLLSQGP
jgi:co-chaperonin GroES (HSP10)